MGKYRFLKGFKVRVISILGRISGSKDPPL